MRREANISRKYLSVSCVLNLPFANFNDEIVVHMRMCCQTQLPLFGMIDQVGILFALSILL